MQRRPHHLRIRGIRSQGSKEVKESHNIRFYLQSNDGNNVITIRNHAKHLRHDIGITFSLFPSDETNERSFFMQINELNFEQKVLLSDLPGFWDPTADGKEFFHRFQQDSISIILVLAWNFKQVIFLFVNLVVRQQFKELHVFMYSPNSRAQLTLHCVTTVLSLLRNLDKDQGDHTVSSHKFVLSMFGIASWVQLTNQSLCLRL